MNSHLVYKPQTVNRKPAIPINHALTAIINKYECILQLGTLNSAFSPHPHLCQCSSSTSSSYLLYRCVIDPYNFGSDGLAAQRHAKLSVAPGSILMSLSCHLFLSTTFALEVGRWWPPLHNAEINFFSLSCNTNMLTSYYIE